MDIQNDRGHVLDWNGGGGAISSVWKYNHGYNNEILDGKECNVVIRMASGGADIFSCILSTRTIFYAYIFAALLHYGTPLSV